MPFIIKWATAWRKIIRLEHTPFLVSSTRSKTVDADWIVSVIHKWPLRLIGNVDVYLFKGAGAFGKADRKFVQLCRDEFKTDATLTAVDKLGLGRMTGRLIERDKQNSNR